MYMLITAALLPPLFLLWRVYQSDKIEKEPPRLIAKIFIFGMISTIPAVVLEMFGQFALSTVSPSGSLLNNLLMAFVVVAGSEEIVKYFFMKKATWRNPDFNYVFDGVVYGVTSSLGFAALENIFYVLDSGLGTAGMRAVTSIPGHCIFGIYMGHYYGIAKSADVHGYVSISDSMRRRAVLIPMLMHGAYDFILFSLNAEYGAPYQYTLLILFLAYIIAADVFAIRAINSYSKNDLRMF